MASTLPACSRLQQAVHGLDRPPHRRKHKEPPETVAPAALQEVDERAVGIGAVELKPDAAACESAAHAGSR